MTINSTSVIEIYILSQLATKNMLSVENKIISNTWTMHINFLYHNHAEIRKIEM